MSADPALTVTQLKQKSTLPRAPRVFDVVDRSTNEAINKLESLRSRHKDKDAHGLLHAMIVEEFPGTIAVVSSFGAESVVLLHLISEIDPTVPVLFLNTGKLFGETLRYRDRLQDQLGLTDIRSLGPHPKNVQGMDPHGTLWSKDPNACCDFRKVQPLKAAISQYSAEITGRKRFQTQTRQSMSPLELNGSRFIVNPLWSWTLEDLKSHIIKRNLPRHPLVADGYLSIGCQPCTDRVKSGEDYRSGRWAGTEKDECGIYVNGDGDGI